MRNKWAMIAVVGFGILCFFVWGSAVGQPKKVGGGEIKYTPQGVDPVVFSHESHVAQLKLKCTDCHTKVFKMKREDLKMTWEAHGKNRHCGVCHNGQTEFGGKKTFSMTTGADCAKCHKKS